MNDSLADHYRRLLKVSTWTVVLLGVFLLFASLNAIKNWRNANPVYNSISVMGTGEAYSVPDVASFSFSVSADAKNVSEAQNTVTNKMDAVLASLKDFGVEDKDIKTNDYSVYPKYTYRPAVCSPNGCPPSEQVADGYTVTHSVLVKIRKTADAGKALSAVGQKGATNVSGVSFTTDDPNKTENEARAKAIDDAKSKAEALAKHLGVRLVRVVGFYDTNPGGPYPMYDAVSLGSAKAMSAVQAAPSLPAGQNKVVANITVNYEIR